MKQLTVKKLLVSGAAAFGILGLSTPAAFAWSGNSGYGGYSSNNRMNYSSSYGSYNSYHKHYTPCYRANSHGYNEYGGKSKGCKHFYTSHKKGCDHYGSYQTASYW